MDSPKRGKIAAIILAGAKKPGPGSSEAEDDGGAVDHEPDDGMVAACEDAIDAMRNRDAVALSKAFANWMELYKGPPEETEEDTE